ncbi:hypothetical protein HWB79_gp185 [Streptomyces phage LukeCage]|uniref:Uncharacterized protein n=1 Tax=Streptomyces phage LukeCage TaxID=2283304 RepID=A0A345MGE6_9CAUD|nr:hypothetical protein HWB79_gp185 [Streptomyces phage LukeCage]AXH69627.1 hypothetical protein SEA_LUKECAGE_105 [Streptomyces phage LukeCage]
MLRCRGLALGAIWDTTPRYHLEIVRDSERAKDLIDNADNVTIPGSYELNLSRLLNDNYDTMKWYDWEDDMASLSRDWPNVLFALSGEGEEPGDLWKAWVRNGKVIKVEGRIVYDVPNLDKVLPINDTVEEKYRAEKKAELQATIKDLENRLQELKGLSKD